MSDMSVIPVMKRINRVVFSPGLVRRLLATVSRWDLPSAFDWEICTLMRKMSAGGTLVDVGSSAGVFFEVFLERGCDVISIEPRPDAADHQKRRFARYMATGQLKICQIACSDRAGTAVLRLGRDPEFSSLETEWTASVFPAAYTGQTLQVKIKPLAEILAGYGGALRKPFVLKIDVEGHEDAVLQGLFRQTAAVVKPSAVMFEFHTSPSQQEKIRRCIALLNRNGYRRFRYVIRYSDRLLHRSCWVTEFMNLSAWDQALGDVPAGYRYGNVIAV